LTTPLKNKNYYKKKKEEGEPKQACKNTSEIDGKRGNETY